MPAVLRTDSPPSPAAIDSTVASNTANLPFLAFNPGVEERGGRALWEAHLAYYYGGLSALAAIEGGHESYATSGGPSIHVPIRWLGRSSRIPSHG